MTPERPALAVMALERVKDSLREEIEEAAAIHERHERLLESIELVGDSQDPPEAESTSKPEGFA